MRKGRGPERDPASQLGRQALLDQPRPRKARPPWMDGSPHCPPASRRPWHHSSAGYQAPCAGPRCPPEAFPTLAMNGSRQVGRLKKRRSRITSWNGFIQSASAKFLLPATRSLGNWVTARHRRFGWRETCRMASILSLTDLVEPLLILQPPSPCSRQGVRPVGCPGCSDRP